MMEDSKHEIKDRDRDKIEEGEEKPGLSPAQKLAYKEATGRDSPLEPDARHTRVLARSTLTIPVEAGKILGIGHPVRADAYELSVQREDGAVESIVVPRWAHESAHFYPGSYYVVPLKDDEPTEPPLILPAALFIASGGTVFVEPAPPTGGETGATGATGAARGTERHTMPAQGAKGAPTPSSTIKR